MHFAGRHLASGACWRAPVAPNFCYDFARPRSQSSPPALAAVPATATAVQLMGRRVIQFKRAIDDTLIDIYFVLRRKAES